MERISHVIAEDSEVIEVPGNCGKLFKYKFREARSYFRESKFTDGDHRELNTHSDSSQPVLF